MSRSTILLALAGLSLFSLSCGDDDDGSTLPQYVVGVSSAEYRKTVGSQHSGSSARFLVLSATLENLSSDTPLSLDMTRFTVESQAAIVFNAGTQTALLDSPCSAEMAVARGGKATCGLVFSIPTAETPKSLVYANGYARQSASIPEPTVVETECETVAGWTRANEEPCSSCNRTYCGDAVESCSSQETAELIACTQGGLACSCLDALSTPCRTEIESHFTCLIEHCVGVCE